MSDTLADALPREIARVREMQDMYKTMRALPGVNVEMPIALMEAELRAAIQASAEGDVAAMARSLAALREWEN